MEINIEKIEEVHGIDILHLINENVNCVVENIKYLKELNIDCTDDILERYPMLLIEDQILFKQKIDKLASKLGNNYVEIIGNDLGILEDLV